MDYFKKNMVYIFAFITGCLSFVAMGFHCYKRTGISSGISGWDSINFQGTAASTFGAIFLLLCFLASLVLLCAGLNGLIALNESSDGKLWKINCKKIDKTLKIKSYLNWILCGYVVTMLLAMICISVYCSQISETSSFYTINYHIGWGPLLMFFVSLGGFATTFIFELIKKNKEKQNTKMQSKPANEEDAKLETAEINKEEDKK